MPDKEGAEEKSTKSVVNKKQKQMMGEEGYDHLRDMGRIRKNKKKKDATTMPPSKEMEKTRKVNKGPSALELVKKKYKGQIMDVKKEELDLTQVAEAFGGFIVEKKKRSVRSLTGNIPPEERVVQPDADKTVQKRIRKAKSQQQDFSSKMREIEGDPQTKKIKAEVEKASGQKTREFTQTDKNVTRGNELKQSPINQKPKVTQNLTGTKPKITGDVTGVKKRNLFPKAGSANTPAVKKVKSGIAKRLATQTKTAQKKIIKTVGRKAATKGIAKVGGKFVAKRIPGLGAIISGAEAVGKLATGDVVGAGLAAGEGILSSIPGVGTVASTALGGYSAVRDARRAAKAASTVRKVVKSTKGAKGAVAVKKAFRTSPKTITKKLSPTSKKGFKGFMSKVKDPKTGIGKLARVGGGVALDVATPGGITKRLLGIGRAARPKVDGSHVGRRTAG